MAKNLLPELISCLRTFIQTEEFKSLAREADTDFTRDRKLKLKDYIYMIINRPSTSLTDMIRKYTDEMKDTPVCSKQAFSKGRKRIRPESIRGLISRAAEFIQRNSSGLKTWNGLQVFAVDGSRINLPDSKESRRYFGIQKGSGEQVQGYTMYSTVSSWMRKWLHARQTRGSWFSDTLPDTGQDTLTFSTRVS